jgi:hypothetical protein
MVVFHLPLLIEARTAKDWPVLARHERDDCGGAALRTGDAGFDAGALTSSFGFAPLAALGFMLELLLAEEDLLPGAEDEVLSAIDTLQSFVREFHGATSGVVCSCALVVCLIRLELRNLLQKRASKFLHGWDYPGRSRTGCRVLISRTVEKFFTALLQVLRLHCAEVL